MKIRRVGTITLGTSLVFFGCILLLRLFNVTVSYELILKLWPFIFIFLGIEILVSHFSNREVQFKYDVGAILILAMLTAFAIGMAFMEAFIDYANWHIQI